MKLNVLTYNTLFAGQDSADDHRARAQIGLLNELRPDIFLMQEAKGFDAGGATLLYALEARIGMRGLRQLLWLWGRWPWFAYKTSRLGKRGGRCHEAHPYSPWHVEVFLPSDFANGPSYC